MIKRIFYIGCILITGACIYAFASSTGKTNPVKPGDLSESSISSVSYDLMYVGVLPCKDCGGIKTTLQLSTKAHKFKLKEEFLKTKLSPVTISGHFTTERGYAEQKSALLYILNDNLAKTEWLYFLEEQGMRGPLLKLDSEGHKTNHTNYTLNRVLN